ncbi:alpha/beta hydrolase family protein [Altererythrobacter sp. CAU 1778]
MISSWTTPDGLQELAIAFDRARSRRVLVIPALFDEASKMRRLTVEVMRRLDGAGIDSFLPDLPGTNESRLPLSEQTVSGWRADVIAAAGLFGATGVLAIRAGAILAPAPLPARLYAPQSGTKLLRTLLRAQALSSKEAGRPETMEELLARGRSDGVTLAGYSLGSAMVEQLESAGIPSHERLETVTQPAVGGAGLWLRAEPDYDAAQADALADVLLRTAAA